jgi:hypothetical protein
MVFLGTAAGTTSIYTATRDSMAVLFATATMVIEDEVEKHPFLTQDCQVLYYFRATGSTVIRAD